MAGMVAQGITIKFSANTSGLTDGAQQAQGVINGFAKTAGIALLAVGAATIAGGVAATKMAGDFQAGMTSLVTGAGESQNAIGKVSSGILDMATQTGTSTQQLTDGMYMIDSAGYTLANGGLAVLKSAAEGAKVGNADLKDVANGVTTALKDYNLPASQAAAVTNDLVATVANGKTTMGALSSSLKDILPIASSAGISLNGVSAAMATMTGEGVPAGQAADYLKTMVLSLEAPGSKATTTLKSIGLSAQDVASEMKDSLPGALQMITDHLKTKIPEGSAAYTAALKDITGGQGSLSAMMDLTGDHMKTFEGNVDNVYNAVKNGGSSITGWSKVQGDFNFKMDQSKEVLETTGIKIGTALLPAAGKLLDKITPLITKFGDWVVNSGVLEGVMTGLGNTISTVATWIGNFANFLQHNQAAMEAFKGTLMVVAGIIGGVLVQALVAWAVANIPVMITTLGILAPYILVGAIVGAVVFGIIEAIQHWGAITKWFQGVWGAVSSWFMGIVKAVGSFFTGIWTGIASFFTGVWNGIVAGVKAAWAFIVNAVQAGASLLLAIVLGPIFIIANAFVWLYNHNTYFKMLVDAIVNFFKMLFSWLVDGWNTFIAGLVATWNHLVSFAVTIWTQVSGAIRNGFIIAIDFIVDIWTSISTTFSNAWNTYIAKPLAALWTTVSTFFSGVWSTYIAGPIGNLWNQLTTAIGGWAGKAVDWGKNLIKGFVNGIIASANSVAGAVGGIAGKVLAFLGFHSPTKEGPGQEADVWAPNFVKMYAKGLTNGLPEMQKALNTLAMPLAINFSKPNYAAMAGARTAGAASNNQTIIVQSPDIYLDSRKVTKSVTNTQMNMMRSQGGLRRQ